jgi:hypothetical protein
MKYTLIKYKNIKLLINKKLSTQPIIDNLSEIERLHNNLLALEENSPNITSESIKLFEQRKKQLINKIGYSVIGIPFTNQDAELYAQLYALVDILPHLIRWGIPITWAHAKLL